MAIRFAQSEPKSVVPVRLKAPARTKHAGGRPKSGNPRALLTLRLKPETIAKFKATGKGWQSRISDILDGVKL